MEKKGAVYKKLALFSINFSGDGASWAGIGATSVRDGATWLIYGARSPHDGASLIPDGATS